MQSKTKKNKNHNKNTRKRKNMMNKKYKKTTNIIVCYQGDVEKKWKGGDKQKDFKDLKSTLPEIAKMIPKYYIVVEKPSAFGKQKELVPNETKTTELQKFLSIEMTDLKEKLSNINFTDIEGYNIVLNFIKDHPNYKIDKFVGVKPSNMVEDLTNNNVKGAPTEDDIKGFQNINSISIDTKSNIIVDFIDDKKNYELITSFKEDHNSTQIPIIEYCDKILKQLKSFISAYSLATGLLGYRGTGSLENIGSTSTAKDLKKVIDIEKLFHKIFSFDFSNKSGSTNDDNKDVDTSISDKLDELLDKNLITQEEYEKMKSSIGTSTTPISTKITEAALGASKLISEWIMPKSVSTIGKKHNIQTVKLLWFPRRTYIKNKENKENSTDTTEKTAYGQFMVLIEPEKFTNSFEFINQSYYGVEDLLTNIMDGCPGMTCSDGAVRHKPYKAQIMNIMNYQPEFDEKEKKQKQKEKENSSKDLTAENLEKHEEQFTKLTAANLAKIK